MKTYKIYLNIWKDKNGRIYHDSFKNKEKSIISASDENHKHLFYLTVCYPVKIKLQDFEFRKGE